MSTKHIRESIINRISKNHFTLRSDTVRKAIESSEYESIKCDYNYTDDYIQDAANNFTSQEDVLEPFKRLKPRCYINGTAIINGKECYVVDINFHSNLAYAMYVTVEPS